MSSNLAKKIDDLNQKLAHLKAQKSAAENRERAKNLAVNRKADTRKKILLGAFVLDQVSSTGISGLEVGNERFDEWLTRPEDRLLFGLATDEVDR